MIVYSFISLEKRIKLQKPDCAMSKIERFTKERNSHSAACIRFLGFSARSSTGFKNCPV